MLGKTLGVPLFQEQAMQVAMVAAGFSPTEADQLRRAMATFKFTGGIHKFQDKLITGMLDNGYTREFAERTFRQLEGFGSYGFPESHAASFALIAYASSWMKCHHPDVFLAAILNAQPMGFYAPAQLVRDAREHGVEVRPVDVNLSEWDCTLEPIGRAQHARSASASAWCAASTRRTAEQLVDRRTSTDCGSRIASTSHRSRKSGAAPPCRSRRCTHIAAADGFGGLGLSRREASLGDQGACATKPCRCLPRPTTGTACCGPKANEPAVALAPMTQGREVVEDYRSTGPQPARASGRVSCATSLHANAAIMPCATLRTARNGRRISIAGLVLVRQMPGSAKGVMFITLEDESANANLIVWPSVFEKNRRARSWARPCWAAGARCSAPRRRHSSDRRTGLRT